MSRLVLQRSLVLFLWLRFVFCLGLCTVAWRLGSSCKLSVFRAAWRLFPWIVAWSKH
jgi:hypothetical protein